LGFVSIDQAIPVGVVPGEILLHGRGGFLLGNFSVPVLIKSLDRTTPPVF
jgi:hypothetical protein